jgi:hypothetical protein
MERLNRLDRVHHFIMQTFVDTGRAPHYTDIAHALEVDPDAGKQLLHELMDLKLGAMWLHPGTDFIVAFGPFSSLPTQYRITVGGRQQWFAP